MGEISIKALVVIVAVAIIMAISIAVAVIGMTDPITAAVAAAITAGISTGISTGITTATASASATATAFCESGIDFRCIVRAQTDGRGTEDNSDKSGNCQGTYRMAGVSHGSYSKVFSPKAWGAIPSTG